MRPRRPSKLWMIAWNRMMDSRHHYYLAAKPWGPQAIRCRPFGRKHEPRVLTWQRGQSSRVNPW